MRGRKPKPTVLKNLHGSEEPRNSAEPIPDGDLVDNPSDCPEHFNAEQREVWEYALRHSPPGLLKRIDGSALEAWVVAHCLHRAATREQNALAASGRSFKGLLFRQGPQMVPSPFIGIISRQGAAMLKAASELGFTPVSRPRIFAGGPATGETLRATDGRAKDAPRQSLETYLANAPRPQAIH
jgi:phage terminase small subunit